MNFERHVKGSKASHERHPTWIDVCTFFITAIHLFEEEKRREKCSVGESFHVYLNYRHANTNICRTKEKPHLGACYTFITIHHHHSNPLMQ